LIGNRQTHHHQGTYFLKMLFGCWGCEEEKHTHTHLFRDERNFLRNVSIIKVKIISMRVCVKKGGVWW
jgi:hypothetical protein